MTADTTPAPFVCVWPGSPGECQNCGGSTTSVGDDGTVGPFPGDERFCSEECFVDHLEFTKRDSAWRASEWCPSCGFDRHEHAEGCEATTTLSATDIIPGAATAGEQSLGPVT